MALDVAPGVVTDLPAPARSMRAMVCEACAKPARAITSTRCASCGGLMTFRYAATAADLPRTSGRMWDYRAFLPVADGTHIVSLGEGGTPLLRARNDWGCEVYWKNEAQNPTGSQKDRALSIALTEARALRAERVVIASTGSAGLSCAAYSARAGIPCLILVPQGLPRERVMPMHAFGAVVAEVAGSFETIETITARLSEEWYQASTIRSVNPAQAEAAKTVAFEIVATLGHAPDWVIVPVGGGGTFYGIWRGFRCLLDLEHIDRMPRMVSVQVEAFNTVQRAVERGVTDEQFHLIAADSAAVTAAINLKHRIPPDLTSVLQALRDSNGLAVSVSEQETLEWQSRLGSEEGIFCERSSAVVAAATAQLIDRTTIGRNDSVVAVITGSGMRDMSALVREPLPRIVEGCDAQDLVQLLRAKSSRQQ
jgi:threonine synthase